jgi:PAS domain S-box-containing protein/diguanylate cyclase (GGDEF)-like protein
MSRRLQAAKGRPAESARATARALRILLVEDSERDAELVLGELKRGAIEFENRRVQTEADFAHELNAFRPHLILSDFSLPGFSGMAALRIWRQADLDIPFIFVSGTIGEDAAVEAMKAGAHDYVMKQDLGKLVPAIRRELGEAEVRGRSRVAEAGLRRAQQMARLAHIITAPDGSFETWSDTLPQLIGVPAAELPASTREWLDLLHAQDRQIFRAAAIDAGRQHERRDVEYRLRRPDGTWVHVRQTMEPLDGGRDATGRSRWFNTLQDVSEQKRAEESLHRFRLALDNSADIVVLIDRASMRFADVNETACKLLGYTREEMLGMGPQDVLPVSREELEKSYDGLISNPLLADGMTSYYRRRDGSRLPFESTRRALHSGDRWLVVAISRDIRERIAAEQALRESAALQGAILASSLDALVTIDHEGRIIEFNPAAEAIFGFSREQALGKPIAQTIIPPRYREAHNRGFARYLATGEGPVLGKRIEIEALRADGTEFPIELAITPVRSGAAPLFTAFVHDITARKQAEARIRRLNRVYAVLSGINAAIVRIRDRQELLQEACRIAVQVGKLRFAWIGIVEQDAMRLKPVASEGLAQDFLAAIEERLSLGESTAQNRALVAQAAVAKQALISNDVANDPRTRFKKEHAECGIRSLAALPLIVSGRVIGVFALHAAELGFFDDDEMTLLNELASDIAFGIDHIEQEERVIHLTRVHAVLGGINALIVRVRDRDELFREACRIAVDTGKFKLAWIGLVDRAAMRLRPIAWHGGAQEYIESMPLALDEAAGRAYGLGGRAVNERRAMISNDMTIDSRIALSAEARRRGFHSLAMLPLSVSGEVMAVLALYATEIGFFDDEEMKLLRELAGDIAFAIEHIAKSEKLDYLAYYDSLTGLANRTLFLERVEQQLAAARRTQQKMAVSLLDIERFKSINDAFGRQAGDALLKQVAERMLRASADPTRVARIAADHFGAIAVDVKSEEQVAKLTESRLAELFEQPFTVADSELRLSGKAGIALFPSDGADAESLFKNAEAALKKAKASGERYLFHTSELTARVAEHLSLENKLRLALERDEFVLHYQPKIELQTGRIVGVEALIRWQSPELGLVPPVRFISLLEQTGLILQVGTWALKRASLEHRAWTERKLGPPRVAVNVSPVQLRQREFVSAVEQAIMEGVAPVGIDLEITESLLMEDVEANIEKLSALRALGINIAIDDFGTGYSSLGYLAKLPVQALKIDRSFIITMNKDPNALTLVSTIISLAHSLRLKVIAEGVDSEEQAKFLRLLRCDEMQGYLFSKPLPAEDLVRLLQKA